MVRDEQKIFDKLYFEILDKVGQIYKTQSEKYDEVETPTEKMIYGLKSLIHEVYQKVTRVRSLENKQNDCLYYEQLMDCVYDAINYLIFTAVYLKQKCKGEQE